MSESSPSPDDGDSTSSTTQSLAAQQSEETAEGGDTSNQTDLEQRSMIATIKSVLINKWTLAVACAGVIVAIIFGVVSCNSAGGDSLEGNQSGTGNTQNQNQGGTQNILSGVNIVEISGGIAQIEASSATDVELKQKLAQTAIEDPAGPGPWPFVVVDTDVDGLFVRSTNEIDADRIGFVKNRSVIWVDCQATSKYTPVDPINDVGPKWFQIRWKNTAPSQQRFESDPSDQARGWVYGGLIAPYGQNGAVPSCA